MGASVVETAAVPITEPEPAPVAPQAIPITPPALQPVTAGKVIPLPRSCDRLFALRPEKKDKDRMQALEQFRVLRSRVLEVMRSQGKRTLMVTSAVSNEGKTVTSINLAIALSQLQGMKVLLVDADLRKPGVAALLGVEYECGLQHYLQSQASLSQITVRFDCNLSFIPSAGIGQSSAELLHSARMQALMDMARRDFDVAIFDAPPLLPLADARVTANLVDGVLFCVRAGSTSGTTVNEAIDLVRTKLIGSVLACADSGASGQYYYIAGSDGKE
jgi:non-specific protein-tyrosine kinase